MEQTPITEKRKPNGRLWLRIVAIVLVIGMIATAGLFEASRVLFNAASGGNDAETGAAGYIGETTGYLDANTAERMANVLNSYIRKPVTYEDNYLRMSVEIARENYENAAESCKKCIELWSEGEDDSLSALWTKLGCLHALMGDYTSARDELSTAIELDGSDAELYMLRAQMNAQLGNSADALADIESYEAVSGDVATFSQIKGPLLEMAGEYGRAEEAYTALLAAGGDASLYSSRARVRLLTEDYVGAREDADAFFAAGLTDEAGTTGYILAVCCMQQGDYPAAQAAFEGALENGYPTPTDIYPSLVYVKYMQNDLDGALETGETALTLIKDNAELYEWMGVICIGKEDYPKAAEYLEKCIALDDTREQIHYYLGVCAVAKEDYTSAIDHFTVSIERGESLAVSLYNRGVCYAATSEYNAALSDMEAAISASDDAQLTAQAEALKVQLKDALR